MIRMTAAALWAAEALESGEVDRSGLASNRLVRIGRQRMKVA